MKNQIRNIVQSKINYDNFFHKKMQLNDMRKNYYQFKFNGKIIFNTHKMYYTNKINRIDFECGTNKINSIDFEDSTNKPVQLDSTNNPVQIDSTNNPLQLNSTNKPEQLNGTNYSEQLNSTNKSIHIDNINILRVLIYVLPLICLIDVLFYFLFYFVFALYMMH